MDRKNKKAAQVAAGGSGGGAGKDGAKGGPGRGAKRDGPQGVGGIAQTRNPLLSGGSTAPTRVLQSSGRPPMNMPLKATISPSAPAPPLQDTDFASFGVLDETTQLASAPAQGKTTAQMPFEFNADSEPTDAPSPDIMTDGKLPVNSPPTLQGLPVSSPRRLLSSTNTRHAQTPSIDFGPIGSPTRSASNTATSPPSMSRVNGFSPGTSPSRGNGANNNFLSSSPFSAPGAQSVFLGYGDGSSQVRGGLAASLGSGMAMGGAMNRAGRGWNNEFGPIPSHVSSVPRNTRAGEYEIGFEYEDYGVGPGSAGIGGAGVRRGAGTGMGEIAVEDEDLEDFLPSSLTDLLTPEERNRRMSRSTSGQTPGVVSAGLLHDNSPQKQQPREEGRMVGLGVPLGSGGNGGNGSNGGGHRYSRSVPAPSLLGDIKSIWADTPPNNNTSNQPPSAGLPSSPTRLGLGSGTPSSFTSASASFGGRAGVGPFDPLADEAHHHSPSPSLLSPSNASAAFLPGLHHHYLNAKTKRGMASAGGGVGSGLRNTSSPLYPPSSANPLGLGGPTNTNTNTNTNNYLQTVGSSTHTPSPSHLHTFGAPQPSPFDPTQQSTQQSNHPSDAYLRGVRPIPSQTQPSNEDAHVLSPSARALQAHAPGTSLPQGLAAGYSRIHALPPLPLVSPGSAGFGVGGAFAGGNYGGSGTEWGAGSATSSAANNGGASSGNSPGLDSMFSRLSYSAAAARVAPTATTNLGATASGVPAGMARNVSGGVGRQQWSGQGQATHGQGGALSPLSGPVVSGHDDDDLFSMDG